MDSKKSEQFNEKILNAFSKSIQELSNLKKSCTNLQNEIRQLQNMVEKNTKNMNKEIVKHKQKGNRKPSGFAKPSSVTNELCKFMGREKGSKIARTEVTQHLINYIKENNLTHKENKKIILPDSALKNLLDVNEDDEVTYFNIQKFMNKHFKKKGEVLNT